MPAGNEMKKKIKKRLRLNPYKKWSEQENNIILDYILNSNNFEQPSAQIYYREMIRLTGLDADWSHLRMKVKNMRTAMRKANDWRKSEECEQLDGPDREFIIERFGIIFYYMFTDLKPFDELKPVQDIYSYPLFFGSTLFAFEAPGLIVSVEANMRTPKSYMGITGVLSKGITTVVVMQLIFGFCGYWRYGEDIKSSILQSLPYDEVPGNIARIIFAFSMFISHPLQGYVSIDVIWNNWLKAKVAESKALWLELVFRLSLAVLSVVIAVALPNLTLMVSLVGAFSLSFLGLIFPALIDISLRYEGGYGPLKIYLILSIVVIACALADGITGSYVPIEQLIQLYKNGTNLTG